MNKLIIIIINDNNNYHSALLITFKPGSQSTLRLLIDCFALQMNKWENREVTPFVLGYAMEELEEECGKTALSLVPCICLKNN